VGRSGFRRAPTHHGGIYYHGGQHNGLQNDRALERHVSPVGDTTSTGFSWRTGAYAGMSPVLLRAFSSWCPALSGSEVRGNTSFLWMIGSLVRVRTNALCLRLELPIYSTTSILTIIQGAAKWITVPLYGPFTTI